MQVDPLTVVAQVLNFALLVLLLRRVLYGRITRVIDARQREIAARMDEAERRRVEAEDEAERHRQLRHTLEAERDVVLARSREEAREQGERLLREARAEVARERAEWQHALRREQGAFLRELRERAGAATFAAVRGMLRDLAGEDVEQRVVETFRQRLAAASSDDALRRALTGAREIVVRTAFPLDEAAMARLAATVREHFPGAPAPRVERDADVVLGIQLVAGDHVVGWSAADYVAGLEEEVDRYLALDGGPARDVPSAVEA